MMRWGGGGLSTPYAGSLEPGVSGWAGVGVPVPSIVQMREPSD